MPVDFVASGRGAVSDDAMWREDSDDAGCAVVAGDASTRLLVALAASANAFGAFDCLVAMASTTLSDRRDRVVDISAVDKVVLFLEVLNALDEASPP